MNISVLSSKFEIVIPDEIRQNLALKPGQSLEFTIQGDHIKLQPVLPAEDLVGILKQSDPLDFQRDEDRKLGGEDTGKGR